MCFFHKLLSAALIAAILAPAAFANESIYDRDLVRGFLSLKSGFYSMKSNGVKLINVATGESYAKNYLGAQVEIGAEYNKLRTWFDVNFMPITPTRGNTEWYTYGISWMWAYKLLPQNSMFNIIPAIGPGAELQNIRGNQFEPNIPAEYDMITSAFGPTLNLELELRLQSKQFSAGIYGGYKIVRFDNPNPASIPDWRGDINADKVFVGLKLSWTMLNNFQKREMNLQ